MPQAYDPTTSTPYQAPVLPDVSPVAMPSPIPTQAPEANGAVKHSGAIATIADGLLRGVMAGRAYKQAADVMKFKKKDDNLQASYNQDATRLFQLSQAGVDPKSPEYVSAKNAVDGSWGALQDFRRPFIVQEQKGKGGKKAQQAAQEPLMNRLNSPDPHVKTQALFELSQKAGPPVYGQIAMGQRQAQQRAADPSVQAKTLKDQNDLSHQQAVAERDKLLQIPAGQRTADQNTRLTSLEERIAPVAKPVAEKPGDEAKRALDDVFGRLEKDPNYKLTDQDKQILELNKVPTGPKTKLTVTREGEILMDNGDGTYKQLRGPQKEYAAKGRSGGGRGGSGTGSNRYEKAYGQARSYLKEHNPGWDDDKLDREADKMAIKKSISDDEGQSYSATQEPVQFDNKVLSSAIERLQSLPQYRDDKDFSDKLANFVPRDGDGMRSYGKYLGQPDKNGKYSGNLDKKQAQKFEMDLQQQIKDVLNDPKVGGGISPEDRKVVLGRMKPYAHTDAKPPENPKTETAKHEDGGLPEVQGHKPPKGASAPVYDDKQHLIGWAVNGEFQAL